MAFAGIVLFLAILYRLWINADNSFLKFTLVDIVYLSFGFTHWSFIRRVRTQHRSCGVVWQLLCLFTNSENTLVLSLSNHLSQRGAQVHLRPTASSSCRQMLVQKVSSVCWRVFMTGNTNLCKCRCDRGRNWLSLLCRKEQISVLCNSISSGNHHSGCCSLGYGNENSWIRIIL